MHPAPGGADARRQTLFQRRLPVLVRELDTPLAALVLGGNVVQPFANGFDVRVRQELLSVEHFGVRHRGPRVVAHQPLIEAKVLTRRVLEYTVIERRTFVPQASHDLQPAVTLCCSAGVRALTSATIRVPVPSFVNTSPRIPSGAL